MVCRYLVLFPKEGFEIGLGTGPKSRPCFHSAPEGCCQKKKESIRHYTAEGPICRFQVENWKEKKSNIYKHVSYKQVLVHVSTQPLKAAVRRRKSPLDTARRRAQFAGCRLQVAGWKLKKKKKESNIYKHESYKQVAEFTFLSCFWVFVTESTWRECLVSSSFFLWQ